MADTNIEWTDKVWNPLRGCTRVSRGCENCYAERVAARFSWDGEFLPDSAFGPEVNVRPGPFNGVAEMTKAGPRWTGRVQLIEEKLADPLRWKKPSRVFVNSMSDLFHERAPDAWLDQIFAVMALVPRHTFQVLTKRPERMRNYITAESGMRVEKEMRRLSVEFDAAAPLGCFTFPARNVWLGVSVEDQITADARIPLLLQTPAAVRWVSAEPLLEATNLKIDGVARALGTLKSGPLHWVVVGGESGPGARVFRPEWARYILAQGRASGIPVFIKQLGAYPLFDARYHRALPGAKRLADRKGGNMEEWPEDLRVRNFPLTLCS